MDAPTFVAALGTSFGYVSLRAVQQLNVTARRYLWVTPVSMLMAATEVFLVTTQVSHGAGWIILPIGLGGGMGCIAAMAFFDHINKPRT